MRFGYKLLIGVAVIGVGYGIYRYANPSTAPVEYLTDTVKRGALTSTVSEAGEAVARGQFSVTPSGSGVIEKIYVANGDHVKIGQPIIRIKSTATDQERASVYASLLAARNNLSTAQQSRVILSAQAELARSELRNANEAVVQMNNHLGDNKINPATNKQYTQTEIDAIYSAQKVAQLNKEAAEKKYNDVGATIESAQASLAAAQASYDSLQDHDEKAVVEGTITNLSANVGDRVGQTTGTTSATTASSEPFCYILTNPEIQIKTQVNEIDVVKVKLEQKATVALDALPGETFNAHVIAIDTVGTNTQGVVTYNVYLLLDKENNTIKPQMTVNVDIIVDRRENALLVPNAAIHPFQGGQGVDVFDTASQQAETRAVKAGITDGINTEITDGISEGSLVVIGTKDAEASRTTLFSQ